MVEELPNGHKMQTRRQRRDVRADRLIELHLTALHELHDGRRRELLRDRADAIHRVRRGWHAVLQISEAVSCADERVAPTDDDD